MSKQQWNRAAVIGASSGIGEAIARQLVADGARVAVIARRAEMLEALASALTAAGPGRAVAYAHDVTHVQEIPALAQQVAADLGGLDLVVYAAGIMPPVGPDQYPTETDIATIDTNFAGAVAWLNEVATRFGRAEAGTIIGISSVAGDRGRVGNPAYNASKAGLNSYLESLRNRLARRGVTVTTVKPGYVQTPLLTNAATPRFVPVISPEQAARESLQAAAHGKRVAYVPGWWRFIMLVVRAVPAPVFEHLSF